MRGWKMAWILTTAGYLLIGLLLGWAAWQSRTAFRAIMAALAPAINALLVLLILLLTWFILGDGYNLWPGR